MGCVPSSLLEDFGHRVSTVQRIFGRGVFSVQRMGDHGRRVICSSLFYVAVEAQDDIT